MWSIEERVALIGHIPVFMVLALTTNVALDMCLSFLFSKTRVGQDGD